MKRDVRILMVMLSFLTACDEIVETHLESGYPIYLRASMGESPMTRGPYVPEDNNGVMLETPAPLYPLQTDVWGSTEKYVFKEEFEAGTEKPYDGSGTDGKVAIHTDAVFKSGAPQLLRSAIYNETSKPDVYFVAFAPMSGTDDIRWISNDDGTYATCQFTGNDDLMFAPQVAGTYAQDISKSPVLHFRHLLTWVRVEIKAETEAVSNSWGKIKSMKISSCDKVGLDLTAAAYDEDEDYIFSSVVYSNPTMLSFYQTSEEEIYVGSTMHMKNVYTDNTYPVKEELISYKSAKEVAYVLCSPVNATATAVVDGQDVASAEYHIEIVTEKRKVTVPVDLRKDDEEPLLGSTRGKQFTVLLNFKMGNTVYVATSVSDWQSGGIVSEDFGDNDIG